jgi:3-isopropylmalate/(R)-2-methylmalate dehydratase small subunit
MLLKGRAWRFGDNISTDPSFPEGFHLRSDQRIMHAFEDVARVFHEGRECDIIIGGQNFGLGSSREHAPSGH